MNLSDNITRIWLRIEAALSGAGSADLGKAESTSHTSGDVGIMSLGVRTDTPTARAADGEYNPLQTGIHGDLNVDIQHHKEIDACNATTGWTALGNDTTGLTTSTNHVFGTVSLEFDKVDGADNTIFGGIQRDITSLNVEPHIKEGGGFFLWSMNVSSLTDIVYAFIRFGTSSSHYNEWRIPVKDLNTGWNNLRVLLSAPETAGSTGNGWNTSAVTYLAVGCAFSAETDTLANIRIDQIRLNSGLQVSNIELNTSSNIIGKTQPFAGLIEGGLTELIGINEGVGQNLYSGSVEVALAGTASGEILSIMLVQTEDNTGAILVSAGVLFIYDADPNISSGASTMTAAKGVTVIGKIDVAASDWVADADAGIVSLAVAIPFHSLSSLFFAYKHLGATSFNSDGNDDEQLEFNFWYDRWS